MSSLSRIAFACFAASGLSVSEARLGDGGQNGEQEKKVLIGYKTKGAHNHIKAKAKKVLHDYKHVKATSLSITETELEELMSDPDVAYVEEDTMVYPLAGGGGGAGAGGGGAGRKNAPEEKEDDNAAGDDGGDITGKKKVGLLMPYGITNTKAHMLPRGRYMPTASACNDPNSFKVAVIDSGMWDTHPDSPCRPRDEEDTNCKGKAFDLAKGEEWYNPGSAHGTHVLGTIGSLGNNGVASMINDSNICYLVARVFGDTGGALTSSILSAFEWSVDNGAHVINMSLGGGSESNTAQKVYQQAYKQGTLIIAAAGNSGGSTKLYPASYNDVMSVAAVDEHNAKADFSQYNEAVDIAAPGVGILSLVPPGTGALATVDIGAGNSGLSLMGGFMTFSPTPEGGVLQGTLLDCGLGDKKCSAPKQQGGGGGKNFKQQGGGGGGNNNNYVCLIQRGEITFNEKAANCEKGGGSAVVIYNNIPGSFGGTLGSTGVKIPVVSLSQEDGIALYDEYLGQQATLKNQDGYGLLSGTSMASPHVAGAAASIWRSCPSCTNVQVQNCLESTATDLGKKGRDEIFGWGLLRTNAAFQCLVDDEECCTIPTDEPSAAPITSPAVMAETSTDEPTPAPAVDV